MTRFQLALVWSTNPSLRSALPGRTMFRQTGIAWTGTIRPSNLATPAPSTACHHRLHGRSPRRSERTRRVTMSHMKTSTITIRLDDALERELDEACARTGRTRSDLARDALRRQLALLRFERVRRRVLPLAESQGYLTDDDVFRDVS